MFKKLQTILAFLAANFSPSTAKMENNAQEYYRLVEQARREWQEARARFEQISDPDLVDHAIYAIESAEKRYVYLLKKAREEGITLNKSDKTAAAFWTSPGHLKD